MDHTYSELLAKFRRFVCPLLIVLCVLHPCHALTFTDQPESLTVKEGMNIVLVCAVDQTESVSFAWMFNNAPLEETAKVYVDTSNALRIIRVAKEDAGEYRCVVTDGTTSDSITSEPGILNVTWVASEARVQLKSPSTMAEVEEGVRVTLICKAGGNPIPDITWFLDGVTLAASSNIDFTGTRMKIKSATAQDSGTYSCEAANSAGSTTSTTDITLDITDSNTPVLVVAPIDALRALGDSVQFHCEFSGDTPPPVEWYFLSGDRSAPLENETDAGTYIYQNGTLSMDNLMPNDEGEYQCTPITPYGRPHASARLTIATVNPLPVFDVQLIPEDTLKTINCSYPEGDPGGIPTPSLHWLKPNGREVPLNDTKRVHVGEKGNLLVFDPIRKGDEGNYTCRASSIAGEETQMLSIVVSTAPKFTTKPKDVHIKEDEEAALHCGATATPEPSIKWSFDSKDAKNIHGVSILENGTLFIHSASLQHNGTYTCTATTVAVSKTASATIYVKAILKFSPSPVTTDLERGDINRLVCHARADVPPSIRWVKIGHLSTTWPDHITEPRMGVLQFDPAQDSDAGIYMCIATTGLETIKATININVFVKPKFQIKPNNTIGYEGFALRIDCTAYGDPTPTVSWMSRQITNDPEHFKQLENGSLVISEVAASHAGKYQCIAGSDAGLNTTEITLSVQKGSPLDTLPVGSDAMVRTIAIAVGCAVAYILLVVGLMLWCRQRRRRHRRKLKNMETLANGGVVAGGGAGAHDPMLNEYREENGKVVDGEIALGPTSGKNHHGNHHYQRGSYDKLQFPRHDMQTITVIGHGAYGEVSLARAAGIKDGEEATTVMVKALQTKEESLQLDFRREIEMLCKLNHENIVKLLGVCRDMEPQLMITEYLDWGDLKQFLQATRGENGTKNVPPPLTLSQKLDVVHQVAQGMEQLSANRFIHGDLAARNCLLSPSMEVKICTMSVSQDLYRAEYHEYHQRLIPVRWMPAEAVFEDELSTKSDVWAFGVFVWEVFAQGKLPYAGLDDDGVMRAMIDGELGLEMPAETPDEVEILMQRCWADSPKDRHTFSDITHHLGRMSMDSRV